MNRHSLTGDALKEWRERQNLSQEQLGRLLATSREWLGKLERGEREISAEIFLRFENLRREPRFSQDAPTSRIEEPTQQAHGSPDAMIKEIRADLDAMIRLAGADLGKLGWIREQVRRHLSAPEHWNIHEQVIKQVLADEEQQQEKNEAQNQSARAQGKAS